MERESYIKTLKSIRNAYILLLISFNILGIDILPDWLAFIFIYLSLDIIGKEERSAYLIKKITLSLIIYHLIIWLLPINNYLITMLFAILRLYVNYQLMTNIIDISIKYNSKYTNKLKRVRDILTIMLTISYILWDIVNVEQFSAFAMIYVLIYLILSLKQVFDLSMYIVEVQDNSDLKINAE